MPLPTLKAYRAGDANAREVAKRKLLGDEPEKAAHDVGVPVEAVRDNPSAVALTKALEPEEAELLKMTAEQADYARARAALDSREGRAAWLQGVMTGELKVTGAFGQKKEFPPAARLTAAHLLGKMYGDHVIRHEVKVEQQSVIVFAIPDNDRMPTEHIVDALPDDTSNEVH